MDELKQLMTSLENTAYQRWLKGEGIPVVEGFGVEDVREMRMGAWRRTGGNGAFLNLYGLEGATGMYVAEIPPGGALEPEKHIYEEELAVAGGFVRREITERRIPPAI